MRYRITVAKSLGVDQVHSEDINVAGLYFYEADSPEAALDQFHLYVPIKVLDDFHIDATVVQLPGEPNRNAKAKTQDRWLQDIRPMLVGRTIASVRYMSDEERDLFGWTRSPIVLELDDGLALWPSSDDEGNDAGALFTTSDDIPGFPVI